IRYLLNQDFAWATDSWTILISVITFLGAPAYFRRSSGMAYTAIIDTTSGRKKQAIEGCGVAILLGVCLVALAAYPTFLAGERVQSMPILGISSVFVAMWLGVGLTLFSLFAIEKLLRMGGTAIAAGATVVLVIAAVGYALRAAYAAGLVDMDPFIVICPILV